MADRPHASAATEAHPPAGWVRLGRIGRPFQLAGLLRLRSVGPAADALVADLAAAGADVWLDGAGRTRLRAARRVGGGLVVGFAGAYTPERARLHVHRDLWGPPQPGSPPASGVPTVRAPDVPGPPRHPTEPAPSTAVEAEEAGVAVELLTGAPVRLDGRPYGRVVDVYLGAQALLLVEGPNDARWVPWGAPYVRWSRTAAPPGGEAPASGTVDLVDPPPGLLDDAD